MPSKSWIAGGNASRNSGEYIVASGELLNIGTCIVAGLIEENVRQAFKLPGNLVPLYIMPLGCQRK
jgi:nitroreductase